MPFNFGAGFSTDLGFFTEGNVPLLSGHSTGPLGASAAAPVAAARAPRVVLPPAVALPGATAPSIATPITASGGGVAPFTEFAARTIGAPVSDTFLTLPADPQAAADATAPQLATAPTGGSPPADEHRTRPELIVGNQARIGFAAGHHDRQSTARDPRQFSAARTQTCRGSREGSGQSRSLRLADTEDRPGRGNRRPYRVRGGAIVPRVRRQRRLRRFLRRASSRRAALVSRSRRQGSQAAASCSSTSRKDSTRDSFSSRSKAGSPSKRSG